MSKSILIITLGLFIGTFTACGPKETKTETTEQVEVTTTTTTDTTSMKVAEKVVYQCPMDCEKGKTYEVMGICPVCKMDLAKVEEK